MIVLLLAVLTTSISAMLLYLLWPGAGLGLVWTTAPGGALPFRLRLRSRLPQLLGSDATSAWGVVHVAGDAISAYLLAHELTHCLRARGQWWSYLARYIADPQFRAAEELTCIQLGRLHASDPFLVRIATTVKRGAE